VDTKKGFGSMFAIMSNNQALRSKLRLGTDLWGCRRGCDMKLWCALVVGQSSGMVVPVEQAT